MEIPEIPNIPAQGFLNNFLQGDGEAEEINEQAVAQARDAMLRQARQQVDTEICLICNQDIVRTEFLDHLEPCAQQNGKDVKETHIPKYRFLSTNYMLDQKMFAIRDELEIEFLEVLWDKETVHKMHCVLCKTYNEHLNGDCVPNLQKQAFLQKMDQMLNLHMCYYETHLELKKEREIEQIRQAHENEFEKMKKEVDQRFPSDNVIAEQNRQAEYRDFRERVAEPNAKELQEYMAHANEEYRRQYEFKKRQVEAVARREAGLMDLNKVIEYRKILRDQGWEAAEEFDKSTFPTPQNVPDARNEETRKWLGAIGRRQD
ncbi:Protein CBG24290 [Caenorhabditis briggsae]|uniref:Protein CBG24290 n=1 Tax=Caenorhabditis briggsae TaxID=6238 RepID=A8WKE0_CAEBR|nr:Protein CBG24290 [Caenorhabditis briggsae]CAP20935.2 Protein CBG24290 [Caenorhabditis briggsae]